MRLRRYRMVVGALAVALGSLLVAGQLAIRQPARPAEPLPGGGGSSEVAGATEVAAASSSLASGFDNLNQRLRLPQAGPAPVVVPAAAEPPPGDAQIAPPPERFEEPPEPPAPEPEELRKPQETIERSPGTWAVVIGINNYPGTSYDLKSAVNDANDVNQALAGFGVSADRRLVLRDSAASLASIRKSVEWLVAHAGPDATAVFFYAGHVRKLRSGVEAIVAADGGMMSDAEFAGMLDGLQARKTWIGIAACYGGGFTEAMKSGRVLVAAASADELAYENVSFARSYLVEYMVRRAMIGSGISTVEGAFAAAQEGLKRDFPNRVPVQFDHLAGVLELRVGAGRPPSSPAPPPGSNPGAPAPPSGGGSPPPPPPSPPPEDGCAGLTAGLVHCKPS